MAQSWRILTDPESAPHGSNPAILIVSHIDTLYTKSRPCLVGRSYHFATPNRAKYWRNTINPQDLQKSDLSAMPPRIPPKAHQYSEGLRTLKINFHAKAPRISPKNLSIPDNNPHRAISSPLGAFQCWPTHPPQKTLGPILAENDMQNPPFDAIRSNCG